MASGKSTIGKQLASMLGYDFIDFDMYISEKEKKSIRDIFANKGELYFRKKESEYLKEVIELNRGTIIALGGGTPCYGNNMMMLTDSGKVMTIYLKLSIQELTSRLMKEKESRPLVAHLTTENEMMEFVGKHLFERHYFYNQSDMIMDANGKSVKEITESIVLKLF